MVDRDTSGDRKRRPESPAFRAMQSDIGRGVAAAGLIGAFVNLLHLALPLYTIQIYDRVISSGSMDTLVALTVLITFVLLFQALIDIMRHKMFTILGGRVAAHLGRPVLEAAVETTLRGGAAPASGVVRDLGELRGFVASGTIGLPMDLLMAPLFLLVLFLLHPIYGIVGLVGALLLTATAVATEILARRPTARASHANGLVQAETANTIRNAEVITAMGMLPAVAGRWARQQALAIERVERGRSVAKALAAMARMLRIALQIAVLCAGAVLVTNRLASAGTIIASVVIMSRLLHPFEALIEGWRQWVDAFAALDRVRDVLARGETVRSREPVAIDSASLVVDRATFVPPGKDVPLLRNVSFELQGGELLGVVGPSGAGKSTLARLIVGIWEPSMGGIYLDGQATFGHERGSFGEAVGYLPQDPMLLNGTVAENISRFRAAEMADVVAAARTAGIHEMVGRLPQGYETRLTDAGSNLSGGQRQRLALARAIFGSPKLIVLDEPNSSLDAEGEAALIEAMEAARTGGAAVLVVAQRMSILNRADRLLVLKDGAVAQQGERAEVMAAMGPQRVRRGSGVPRPAVVGGVGQ